jgi:replicative DNA helicase
MTIIDPNNVDEFLKDITATAESFHKRDESEIDTLSDLTSMSNEYFNENNVTQFELGFKTLDEAIGGIDDGDVMIISVRPSVGKSAFALQMIRKFGKDGHKTGYFNLEMSKKQIYERSIASASGIDMTRIRRATNFLNDEKERFERGNKELKSESNVKIITGAQTIKSIREIQQRENFRVIVVDYMQLISSSGYRGNRASEVGDISRGLKKIATDFSIPVIALSQLNRASEHNKDKEPSMSELRESGDIEQDASIILMIWNSNEEDDTEKTVKVEKSRNGYKDRIKLYFDGKHMKFIDESAPTDFQDGTTKDNETLDELGWE